MKGLRKGPVLKIELNSERERGQKFHLDASPSEGTSTPPGENFGNHSFKVMLENLWRGTSLVYSEIGSFSRRLKFIS